MTGSISLNPNIRPRIELRHKDPWVHVVRDDEWACEVCREPYAIDEENKERVCLTCAMKKAGGDSILIMGWKIHKTASQVWAFFPPH